MYPLSTVTIGSDERLRRELSCALWNREATLEAEFSGADEAAAALRRSPAEKRLLILQVGSAEEIDAMSRLTGQFPGWPAVAVVEGYDPKASLGEFIVRIMRAGATQILSTPIQAEEFNAVLDRIATHFVYSTKEAKVIAVAGVTGGSGASTIALNLAADIADRHGLRCVLADFSLRMGVVAAHLNITPTSTILDLLGEPNRIDAGRVKQVLIRVADNLELLAGPNQLVAPTNVLASDVAHVVNTLKQVADVVVLDVPCTYDDIYFETLTAAGEAVMIGEQKLPSIRALKMVREAINRDAGTEHLVVNKFDPKNTGFEVKRLLSPLGVTTLHTVVRDDPSMSIAVERACTLRLASPRSPALADIAALANVVLAIHRPAQTKPAGLFRRLGRALTNA